MKLNAGNGREMEGKKQRHHVIISGTGRTGTTFLVQLFTALGLDTGFETPRDAIFENCMAGMERDIRDHDAPYIIKSPWLCDYIDEVLPRDDIVIDHALIPVRDLYAAAESRRQVSKNKVNPDVPPKNIPGGLWHTMTGDEQERVLAEALYRLIYFLTKHHVPVTLLHFPELALDPDYLFGKLQGVLETGNKKDFVKIFHEISKPGLIHDFNRPVHNAKNQS